MRVESYNLEAVMCLDPLYLIVKILTNIFSVI